MSRAGQCNPLPTHVVVKYVLLGGPSAGRPPARAPSAPWLIRRRLTVFKCIRGMAPTYISDCITICNEVAIRDTTNSTSTNIVMLPYYQSGYFQKNSFAYRSPFTWNALPSNITKCVTLSCFKIARKADYDYVYSFSHVIVIFVVFMSVLLTFY